MILFHVFVLSLFVFCVDNKTLTNISQDYNGTDHGVNGKTMNSTCFETKECIGKLLCLAGECRCCEQHIWNGNDCIINQQVDTGSMGYQGNTNFHTQKEAEKEIGNHGTARSEGENNMTVSVGLPGSKGEMGDKGQPGNKGFPGDKGPPGMKGFSGGRGVIGNKGPIGDKGQSGNKGLSGDKGLIGNKGPIGDKGPSGNKGLSGDKGLTGNKGPIGDKGSTGNKGPIGDKGSTGNKGLSGDKGPTGNKGPIGDKGQSGNKGISGEKGPTGNKGSIGDKGEIGDKGATGEKGSIGQHGDKGQIGSKGPLGDKGLPGEKGQVDAKGQTGDMGIQGQKGQMGQKGSQGQNGRSCETGWVTFGKYCYYFGKNKKTWNDAQNICNAHNGNLVKIENAVENWFLKSVVREMGIHEMWIGANDNHREGTMVWVSDNTNVNKGFSNWRPGEPNNSGRSEDCVLIWKNGGYKWNDGTCSSKFGFICKN